MLKLSAYLVFLESEFHRVRKPIAKAREASEVWTETVKAQITAAVIMSSHLVFLCVFTSCILSIFYVLYNVHKTRYYLIWNSSGAGIIHYACTWIVFTRGQRLDSCVSEWVSRVVDYHRIQRNSKTSRSLLVTTFWTNPQSNGFKSYISTHHARDFIPYCIFKEF